MNYEDYSQWLEDYEAPEIDSIIVGYSGIDPDKKVKAEAINHERLDGLLGGDWAGHYHLTNEQVAKLEGYQVQIDSVRAEANSKISAVAREANEKIASLRAEALSEIARVENEANERIDNLEASTEEQITTLDEKVTETRDEITSRMTDIESSQSSLETKQELIETRFDEVLEGVTEDSEILDARVDAEAVTHKNLGSNIRNLHERILALQHEAGESSADFRELFRQFNALAEAQIAMQVNESEAHDRRKEEIKTEALARIFHDDGLQWQINQTATAILDLTTTIHEINERRRVDLEREEIQREFDDQWLQEQIDELSEKLAQCVEELRNELQGQIDRLANESEEHDREISGILEDVDDVNIAITQERNARVSNDTELARQINSNAIANIENSLAVQREAEARRNDVAELVGKTTELHQADEELRNDLELERVDRKEANDVLSDGLSHETASRERQISSLQNQINKNAQAIIETGLNSSEANDRRKADLAREEAARIAKDKSLQSEIDTAAEAILHNADNLACEAEKRRELAERLVKEVQDREREIKELLIRIGELYEVPLPGIERRFENLQNQANANATANIENSLAIHQEAEQRRKSIVDVKGAIREAYNRNALTLAERLDKLQAEVDRLSEGVIENSMAIHHANEFRREAVLRERNKRFDEDEKLQKQIDTLAETCLVIMANNFDTKRKVEAIEEEVSTEGTNFDDDIFDEAMADLFPS